MRDILPSQLSKVLEKTIHYNDIEVHTFRDQVPSTWRDHLLCLNGLIRSLRDRGYIRTTWGLEMSLSCKPNPLNPFSTSHIKENMSAPVVAWVGINGLLGAQTLPTFVEAAKSGEFASLKLLARSETDAISKAVAEGSGKVSKAIINYDDKSSLVAALKGANVLVSTIGWHGEQAAPALALVEAGNA